MIEPRDFQAIAVFSSLTDEQLDWLVQHAEEVRLDAGGELFHQGDPADYMYVFFEGELRGQSDNIMATFRSYTARAGDVTGLLPFSRLQTFQGTGVAVEPIRLARFHRRTFPEMLQRMPALVERLVGLMLDRVRDTTRVSEQRDKLAALGKLSAGLAHELNNPAAAIKRAADSIMEVRQELRAAQLRLDQTSLTREQRTGIAACEQAAMDAMAKAAPMSPLDRSDREQEVEAWMEKRGVPEPWKLSPMLVEGAIDSAKLDQIAEGAGPEALPDVLLRLNYSVLASRMVKEIEQSATRIFELVKAVKEYTYMDQGPEQEIDIHCGIESTLTILAHKLRKKSIEVERQFDRTLPKICAFGAELNQVWTNIIVNAIEALPEKGGRIVIRTCAEPRDVVVEIEDNGSGIAPEIMPRIFEPFFTTKGVGEGTGLGLDTALRVARKHQGDITVRSQPGETVFKVSLPKRKPASGGQQK